MAVSIGTNAGFVTSAPSADPSGSSGSIDNTSRAVKDVAPVGSTKVTEIGWYQGFGTSEDCNYRVCIYDHNSGDNNPEALVGDRSDDASKGTAVGWKRISGLNIPITAGNTYWIAVGVDNTATTTYLDFTTDAGAKLDGNDDESLPDPWGASDDTWGRIGAIYALVDEPAAAGTNSFINIGDAYKSVSDIFLNIGDSWKNVSHIYINIGDAWKTIF